MPCAGVAKHIHRTARQCCRDPSAGAGDLSGVVDNLRAVCAVLANFVTSRTTGCDDRFYERGGQIAKACGAGIPEEIYPGYPGLVVRQQEGERVIQSMAWGFSYRPKTMKRTSKPIAVNKARSHKLDEFMGRYSFCGAPLPDPRDRICRGGGREGLQDANLVLIAGRRSFCGRRHLADTDEWGPAYSMVMTEACIHVQDVHDRVPVILARETWSDWLDGAPGYARLMCQLSGPDGGGPASTGSSASLGRPD